MMLLEEIKKRLSITGEFHDGLLLGLAEDVKQYMLSAGVKQSVVDSFKSIGCISRGVFDLWTKDSFSDLFMQRVIQLTFEPEFENNEIENEDGGENVLPDDSDV